MQKQVNKKLENPPMIRQFRRENEPLISSHMREIAERNMRDSPEIVKSKKMAESLLVMNNSSRDGMPSYYLLFAFFYHLCVKVFVYM